jgi:hypoxanthine phosphoribosyltransferase
VVRTPAGPFEVLVDAAELRTRVAALGGQIAADYSAATEAPLAVGILKGSSLFLADLLRAIPREVSVDFMSISSYAHTGTQSGTVRILKDLDEDIAGRDVLIVEDIIDTGLTLSYLRRALAGRNPKSLKTVTLLDKRVRRIVPVPVEYVGFEIPDVFVVGYGLDFQGLYRNLEDLLAVTDIGKLGRNRGAIPSAPGQPFGSEGVSFGP